MLNNIRYLIVYIVIHSRARTCVLCALICLIIYNQIKSDFWNSPKLPNFTFIKELTKGISRSLSTPAAHDAMFEVSGINKLR